MEMSNPQQERIVVRLKRGLAGCTERQRATVRALGLKRVGMSANVPRTPSTLGRIAKVAHLVEVVE